jgi:hypothetical protein
MEEGEEAGGEKGDEAEHESSRTDGVAHGVCVWLELEGIQCE